MTKEENSISGEKSGKAKHLFGMNHIVAIVFAIILLFFLIFDKPLNEEKTNEAPSCGDGTLYDFCSIDKPYFCENGILIEKASVCGCSNMTNVSGDVCVSVHETYPLERSFSYILKGNEGNIELTTYIGMAEYLPKVSRAIDYLGNKTPSRVDFKLKVIGNEEQRELLMPLVKEIQNLDNDSVNQVRIAVSLVQNIPYVTNEKKVSFGGSKLGYSLYPYEVIYYNQGICGEKSELLALLLKELGYGVAIFYFPEENHEAVGIKCPIEKSFRETGYCFVETSGPAIISDSSLEYVDGIRLKSEPEVLVISDGISLPQSIDEYGDSKTLGQIRRGSIFGILKFWKLGDLNEKYGLNGVYGLE